MSDSGPVRKRRGSPVTRVAWCVSLAGAAGFVLFANASPARARDLVDVIPSLFGGNGITLATTNHEAHFTTQSLQQLNTLNEGIASGLNIPNVGASTASFTFNVQQAVFVRSTESLGPTLAQRAETIGKGKLNFAWSFTQLNYESYKGDNIHNLNLSLPHIDTPPAGLGNPQFELDTINMNLDINLDQEQYLIYGKYGITDRWEAGLVLPIISTDLNVSSTATIDRQDPNLQQSLLDHNFCLAGGATGWFDPATGGNCFAGHPTAMGPTAPADVSSLNNPNQTTDRRHGNHTGFGDLLVQTKYNFLLHEGSWPDMSVLGAVRFNTGDPNNFTGAGNTGFQGYFIASKQLGMFAPHLNLGAEVTTDGGSTDVWRLIVGSEFTPIKYTTLSVDFLGQQSFNGEGVNDKLWDVGFGAKVNPWSTLTLLGYVILPINKSVGLRTDQTWSLGIEYTF
jgi:hypothetical protein